MLNYRLLSLLTVALAMILALACSGDSSGISQTKQETPVQEQVASTPAVDIKTATEPARLIQTAKPLDWIPVSVKPFPGTTFQVFTTLIAQDGSMHFIKGPSSREDGQVQPELSLLEGKRKYFDHDNVSFAQVRPDQLKQFLVNHAVGQALREARYDDWDKDIHLSAQAGKWFAFFPALQGRVSSVTKFPLATMVYVLQVHGNAENTNTMTVAVYRPGAEEPETLTFEDSRYQDALFPLAQEIVLSELQDVFPGEEVTVFPAKYDVENIVNASQIQRPLPQRGLANAAFEFTSFEFSPSTENYGGKKTTHLKLTYQSTSMVRFATWETTYGNEITKVDQFKTIIDLAKRPVFWDAADGIPDEDEPFGFPKDKGIFQGKLTEGDTLTIFPAIIGEVGQISELPLGTVIEILFAGKREEYSSAVMDILVHGPDATWAYTINEDDLVNFAREIFYQGIKGKVIVPESPLVFKYAKIEYTPGKG